MSEMLELKEHPADYLPDTLHISKQFINAKLSAHSGIDKDTKQYVMFCPGLDISSYGETETKAKDMLKEAIKSYFDYLSGMSIKDMIAELRSLGWTQDKMYNKRFSGPSTDRDVVVKGMNLLKESVQTISLVA